MQVEQKAGSAAGSGGVLNASSSRPRARSPPPKKKMVIKPFKVAPKPPEAFASDTLANLSAAVEAVYAQRHSQFSQEELYRAVEALCNLHKGAEVYARLAQQCQAHIAELIDKLAQQVQNDDEEQAQMQLGSPHSTAIASSSSSSSTSPASSSSSSSLSLPLLHALQSIWDAHCQEMLIIRGIFLFLDRTYVMQQAQAAAHQQQLHHNNNSNNSSSSMQIDSAAETKRPPASLWEMGLTFFCEQLQRHPKVESKLISGLLGLIDRERRGESINRSLLKSLLRMLSALRLYASSFQPRFLADTASFYASSSRKAIASELNVGDYVHFIQQRMAAEEERALAYLDEATRAPLTQSLEHELIATHAEHLLGAGTFTALLDARRVPELAILYGLFARIRQLPLMRAAFEAYVKQTAGRIVQTGCAPPEDPKATAAAAAAASAAGTPAAAAAPAASASASASSSLGPSPTPALPASTNATMVLDLLRLKLTLDEVLTFAFGDDGDFVKALKVSFEHALNCVDNTPAELVAKFIDRVLRTGGKGIKIAPLGGTDATAVGAALMEDVTAAPSLSLSAMPSMAAASSSSASASSSVSAASAVAGGASDDVESLLERVMFLFRYLYTKDVFQAFYKKDLAKRLLLAKSASLDAEKSMIAKIKNECGASFTTKLEGMFKDMELSKDTQKEFEEWRQTQNATQGAAQVKTEDGEPALSAAAGSSGGPDATAPELTVQVLTTGSWPAYTPVECKLPSDVARLHDDFKAFYLNKHSGRKLIWHHSLGTAVLRAHFPRGRRELAVSALQAAVLCLFNEHTRLTLEEIGRYAGLTDLMELKRTLASLALADADVRLLLKEPRNKKLLPTDVFSLNNDFTHRLFRIKINSVQLKETREEQAATSTRVLEDRQYALDACIVRVMKARKTMQHQLLIGEVRGPPTMCN
jgi:cullin-4